MNQQGLTVFLFHYREADGQVGRVGSHSPPNQRGDQRRGESGSVPRPVHLPA